MFNKRELVMLDYRRSLSLGVVLAITHGGVGVTVMDLGFMGQYRRER